MRFLITLVLAGMLVGCTQPPSNETSTPSISPTVTPVVTQVSTPTAVPGLSVTTVGTDQVESTPFSFTRVLSQAEADDIVALALNKNLLVFDSQQPSFDQLPEVAVLVVPATKAVPQGITLIARRTAVYEGRRIIEVMYTPPQFALANLTAQVARKIDYEAPQTVDLSGRSFATPANCTGLGCRVEKQFTYEFYDGDGNDATTDDKAYVNLDIAAGLVAELDIDFAWNLTAADVRDILSFEGLANLVALPSNAAQCLHKIALDYTKKIASDLVLDGFDAVGAGKLAHSLGETVEEVTETLNDMADFIIGLPVVGDIAKGFCFVDGLDIVDACDDPCDQFIETLALVMPEFQLEVGLSGDVGAGLRLYGGGKSSLSEPASFKIGEIGPIPVGPLSITGNLTAFVDVEGSSTSRFDISADAKLTAGVSTEFGNKGGINGEIDVTAPKLDASLSNVELSNNANVKITAGAEVAMLIYGLAGPTGGLYSSIELDADQNRHDECVKLLGSADGRLGLTTNFDWANALAQTTFGADKIFSLNIPEPKLELARVNLIAPQTLAQGSCDMLRLPEFTNLGGLPLGQNAIITEAQQLLLETAEIEPWLLRIESDHPSPEAPKPSTRLIAGASSYEAGFESYVGQGFITPAVDGNFWVSSSAHLTSAKVSTAGTLQQQDRYLSTNPPNGSFWDTTTDEYLTQGPIQDTPYGRYVLGYPFQLVKVGSVGQPLWARRLNNSDYSFNKVRDVNLHADSEGVILVANIDLSETPYVLASKFSHEGQLLWNRVLTLPDSESLYAKGSLALMDGGLLIYGYHNRANQSRTPAFMMRMTTEGELQWLHVLDDRFTDFIYPLDAQQSQSDSNLYLLGRGSGGEDNVLKVAADTGAVLSMKELNISVAAGAQDFYTKSGAERLQELPDGSWLVAGAGSRLRLGRHPWVVRLNQDFVDESLGGMLVVPTTSAERVSETGFVNITYVDDGGALLSFIEDTSYTGSNAAPNGQKLFESSVVIKFSPREFELAVAGYQTFAMQASSKNIVQTTVSAVGNYDWQYIELDWVAPQIVKVPR
ncbi:hypothetical protein [Salinibius halmophilus]|uniref:hypothetical protein n=1 Tax=Salinibius halmophilus TaxID=1853216 RepID=UPI000E669CB9|nr:hypothetical protein [Salinibius halmophilus]